MRVEAGRVRHREVGATQRPLESPPEVPVAGEPQPATLGVAHPELLDRRRLLWWLFAHVPTISGRLPAPSSHPTVTTPRYPGAAKDMLRMSSSTSVERMSPVLTTQSSCAA